MLPAVYLRSEEIPASNVLDPSSTIKRGFPEEGRPGVRISEVLKKEKKGPSSFVLRFNGAGRFPTGECNFMCSGGDLSPFHEWGD